MNRYLIEYALNSLLRNKNKNIFIIIIFTFLVFLITSVFFISNSIKYELNKTVDSLPAITIQKLQGGKVVNIDSEFVNKILQLTGVQDAVARVWGYYYFQNGGVNFTIMGIDNFENQYTNTLQKIVEDGITKPFDDNMMVVGSGVQKILQDNFFDGYFNFILEDGTFKKVKVGGVFKSEIELQANDMILLNKDLAYEVLGMGVDKATDIVVKVANPNELKTIVQKIQLLDPNTRVITNEDYKVSYQNIFDYKSGFFLALFITTLFSFFIIIYDKVSGLSSIEKKEIGLLKALGWRVDDVLQEKFYESFILSGISYILGVILALFFVYILHAPLLRDIFEGYSVLKTSFTLPFVLDIQTLTLVFFITVPIYIASTIIPSWRASIKDADEVIR